MDLRLVLNGEDDPDTREPEPLSGSERSGSSSESEIEDDADDQDYMSSSRLQPKTPRRVTRSMRDTPERSAGAAPSPSPIPRASKQIQKESPRHTRRRPRSKQNTSTPQLPSELVDAGVIPVRVGFL